MSGRRGLSELLRAKAVVGGASGRGEREDAANRGRVGQVLGAELVPAPAIAPDQQRTMSRIESSPTTS
jgi:hypothetical protein